jgi:hypothetical protein
MAIMAIGGLFIRNLQRRHPIANPNATYGSGWILQIRPIPGDKQGRTLTIRQLPLAVFCSL